MLYTHGEALATMADLEAYQVPTLEELRAHATTEEGHTPAGVGSRWRPIHHLDLIQEVKSEASKLGFGVRQEHYNLSKDRHSLYACIDFDAGNCSGLSELPGIGRSIGFRSDNLQRFKLIGVSGARVFVCNNGAIVGDFVFGHKHTNKMELSATIGEGMGKWYGQQQELGLMIDTLRHRELSDEEAAVFLVRAARENVFAWSQAGKIDQEWREPKHEAFRPRNAWSLYNAVTEVAKAWSPRNVERGLRDFPRLLGVGVNQN